MVAPEGAVGKPTAFFRWNIGLHEFDDGPLHAKGSIRSASQSALSQVFR
jgi:hypothetical protein